MRCVRSLAGLAVFVVAGLMGTPAQAFFHLWRFTEFFSNADGSVQFIEMRNTNNNENIASNAQITSQSTGKTFTFPANLSSPLTANKSLLIATPGFASLPGSVTPDFTLPSTSFFNQAGDTVTLSSGFQIDSRQFPSTPTDGVMSRMYPSNTTGTNTPTNFAGATGSLNLSAPPLAADFNDDGSVNGADLARWGRDFAETAGSDADNDGDSDGADFIAWQREFGVGTPATAIPEPTALILAAAALAPLWAMRGRAIRGRLRRR